MSSPSSNDSLNHDLPVLHTKRMRLEALAPRHAQALADYLARNAERFRPTAPPREQGTGTVPHAHALIEKSISGFRDGSLLRLVMLAREQPDRIIGRINFTDIFRGPFQSARLGYDIDAEGRGLMHEGVEAAIAHMFRERRLHRIEANHLLQNARSERVLAKLGFERIGLARDYLFINGAWRDHVINQKINPDFDPAWIADLLRDPPATPR